MFTRRLILGSLLGLMSAIALSACSHVPTATEGAAVTTVYLVRHAEKEDGPDPELTPAGDERAAALGRWMAAESKRPIRVHSTQYKRTLSTAILAIDESGLKTVQRPGSNILIYDPRNLGVLATRLKTTPGRHLVVGHSNTTPELVAFLGGDSGSEINEANEYDRLYVVQFFDDGSVLSELQRFGVRYIPED